MKFKHKNKKYVFGLGNVSSLYIPFLLSDAFDGSIRIAKCECCKTLSKSDKNLPFFKENLKRDRDSYYCGCRGWS